MFPIRPRSCRLVHDSQRREDGSSFRPSIAIPKAFAFAIVGAEHVLRLLPKGTHEYAKFIRPSELAAWCRAADLELTATRGMEYNPLTERYWLSADTSVNYLFACRKPA